MMVSDDRKEIKKPIMTNIFGYTPLELRPGILCEDFEEFVTAEYESFGRKLGWNAYVVKADHSATPCKYAVIWEIPSAESQHRYVTSAGKLTDEAKQLLGPEFDLASQKLVKLTTGWPFIDYIEIVDHAALAMGSGNAPHVAHIHEPMIEAWSKAWVLRDKETMEHTQRVIDITVKLARAMGVDETMIVNVRRGAMLHDIGKMNIPDEIMHKPGSLTETEWLVMRQHPVSAYNILAPIPFLNSALDIPYCHHERWDGKGYPRGLKGEQIPFTARLFSIVDVWDALQSDRPYRSAWAMPEIVAYLRQNSGTQFDPQVVDCFLTLIAEIA